MLLGLSGLSMLCRFDDIVAKWYVDFIVKSTDDGMALLKHQGFKVKIEDNQEIKVTPNMEFFQYEDLDMKDM